MPTPARRGPAGEPGVSPRLSNASETKLLLSPDSGGGLSAAALYRELNPGNAGIRDDVLRVQSRNSSEAVPMDLDSTNVNLTDLASCGGCAAKYSAARLEQLLAGFVPADSENLIVGLGTPDDAAVYRIDDERAIIFTLDFFPPIVDDPRDYGAIAATNALTDVIAMGGTPFLALSIAASPEELPMDMHGPIFAPAA